MRAHDGNVRVLMADLTQVMSALPVPRRQPRRYDRDAVLIVCARGGRLSLRCADVEASIAATGTWSRAVACDAWTFRRAVLRWPADEMNILTMDQRVMLTAGKLSLALALTKLPDFDLPKPEDRQSSMVSLKALDITTLPLFGRLKH